MCVLDVFVQGVKEVTLLGQNVNSYRDTSEEQFCSSDLTQLSRGFETVYRPKQGGLRFSDLLDRVSRIDPDMRIRFTSPHPKDFPDEVRSAQTEKKSGMFESLNKLLFDVENKIQKNSIFSSGCFMKKVLKT